jgi:nitroreductase
MDAAAAIAGRRTLKLYTGAEVPRAAVERLVALAVLAPNHRLSQPWRFRAVDRSGVARLAAFVQGEPVCGAVEARKLPAVVERLSGCGAVVQVACQRLGGPEQQAEDRDACAAAVQNLLVAAHADGIASFWSTSPLFAHPATMRWFGGDPEREAHVGTLWLGVPAGPMPAAPPRRPLAEVLSWA